MITASQQIDRVANSLTDLVKSRAIPARVIKPLVLRLDRIANTLDQRVSSRQASDSGRIVWEKLKKGMGGSPEGTTFTGFDAVQRYGVTKEEWIAAQREGMVVPERGGWEVKHPLHFLRNQGPQPSQGPQSPSGAFQKGQQAKIPQDFKGGWKGQPSQRGSKKKFMHH